MIIEQSVPEGFEGYEPKIFRGIYDFAVDGGAVSTIALMGAALIPLGSLIYAGWVDIHTTLTSGGSATIALQVEAANDVTTAVAVASWTAGRKNILPGLTPGALTANTAVIKTTAARDISAVIATAALTAGRFSVVLLGCLPLA